MNRDIFRGNKISYCGPHFEQLRIVDKDLNEYFMEYQHLNDLLKKCYFIKTKKRTRTWLTPLFASNED